MKTEVNYIGGVPIYTTIHEDSDLSTQEQKDTWLETCNGCEYKNNLQCGYCGCILSTLMTFKTSKCPLNKW